MSTETGSGRTEQGKKKRKRVLGDEWLDWDGNISAGYTSESKKTFLLLSMVVLAVFVLLLILFWYLVVPRFELFGRFWVVLVTVALGLITVALLLWYMLLVANVVFRRNYLDLCLARGGKLFLLMLPLVMRLACSLGISKDRLSHSFIRVSNQLAGRRLGEGPILVLFPRCLRKDIRKGAEQICSKFDDVVLHIAPGGTEARRIIGEISPGAIVAVACERDLVTGIQDVAPRIPVIGIPNRRPGGPCVDTELDESELLKAIEFFRRRA